MISPKLKLSLKKKGINWENNIVRPEHHALLQIVSSKNQHPELWCCGKTVVITVHSWCVLWGSIDSHALNIPAACCPRPLHTILWSHAADESSSLPQHVPMHTIFSAHPKGTADTEDYQPLPAAPPSQGAAGFIRTEHKSEVPRECFRTPGLSSFWKCI